MIHIDNYVAAPLEFFHARMYDLFHELRRNKVGAKTEMEINGSEFSKIIAQAKNETYEKYPNQVSRHALLKSEI